MEEIEKQQSKVDALKMQMAERFRMHLTRMGDSFNHLDQKTKRVILLTFGIVSFAYSLFLVISPFVISSEELINIERISQPIDIYKQNLMKQQQAQQLIPLGKMKGEVDGNFDAFYIAFDQEGQLYINRDPAYGEDRFTKSKRMGDHHKRAIQNV